MLFFLEVPGLLLSQEEPALHTGTSAFQGEPSTPGDALPAEAGGEGREGVQIKAAFEVSIIFGMLLRV